MEQFFKRSRQNTLILNDNVLDNWSQNFDEVTAPLKQF